MEENQPEFSIEEFKRLKEKEERQKEAMRRYVNKYREEHGCDPSTDWQKRNRDKIRERRKLYMREYRKRSSS
jgi:hypothetical protein